MRKSLLLVALCVLVAMPAWAQSLGGRSADWKNGPDRGLIGLSGNRNTYDRANRDMSRNNDWRSDLSRRNDNFNERRSQGFSERRMLEPSGKGDYYRRRMIK